MGRPFFQGKNLYRNEIICESTIGSRFYTKSKFKTYIITSIESQGSRGSREWRGSFKFIENV
jgi:hypothetical protein